MPQLRLELVDDFPRLLELRTQWTELSETIQGLTPFQLPAWLITWWRHFGSGTLRCFLFRRGDQLVGVMPCFLHEWNGARQMTLIGAGISDYLEPAFKPEDAKAIVAQLRDYLETSSDWDVCDWQDLSVDTPLKVLATELIEDVPCTAIPLEGSFEAYWERCGKGLRQNIRRDRSKAEARGNIQFEVTQHAAPDLLEGLIEMHRERWQRKNESGMIEANRSAEFLRDIASEFAACGLLRIFSLRFDRELVAVIFGFAYRGRVSNYLTGFNPEYERLGFGRTLLYESVKHCFENGYSAWDFLRGDEPYKALWRAQPIPKTRLRVFRNS